MYRRLLIIAIILISYFGLTSAISLPSAQTRAANRIAPQAGSLSDPVMTAEGPVRGEILNTTTVFRGIPYAAPPVGPLRWKEPQPAEVRSSTLDAINFGSPC